MVLSLCAFTSLSGCGGGGSGGSGGSRSSLSIVFQSTRDGDAEILRMNGDGKNITRLTENSVSDTEPALSPNGQRIAFTSVRTGNSEIFIIDGGGTRQLTRNAFNDRRPSFSPDGQKVVFVSTRGGLTDLYMIDVSTLQETRLTSTPTFEDYPSFTPDGKILYTSNVEGDFTQIFEMTTDGKNIQALTFDEANHFQPTVSPDGRLLAYISDANGTMDIFIQNRDVYTTAGTPGPESPPAGAPGAGAPAPPLAITADARSNNDPTFGPDGQTLYFSSNRSGNFEIYSSDLDGSNLRRLTDDPAVDRMPCVH